MSGQETPLQQAKRHVLEAEDRVALQRALVTRLEHEHRAGLDHAREALEIMEGLLLLAREHLEREQLEEARRRGE